MGAPPVNFVPAGQAAMMGLMGQMGQQMGQSLMSNPLGQSLMSQYPMNHMNQMGQMGQDYYAQFNQPMVQHLPQPMGMSQNQDQQNLQQLQFSARGRLQ